MVMGVIIVLVFHDCYILITTSSKQVMFLSLSVCLLATLHKNFGTDLHEIFSKD